LGILWSRVGDKIDYRPALLKGWASTFVFVTDATQHSKAHCYIVLSPLYTCVNGRTKVCKEQQKWIRSEEDERTGDGVRTA
jgi:hypothetical protein